MKQKALRLYRASTDKAVRAIGLYHLMHRLVSIPKENAVEQAQFGRDEAWRAHKRECFIVCTVRFRVLLPLFFRDSGPTLTPARLLGERILNTLLQPNHAPYTNIIEYGVLAVPQERQRGLVGAALRQLI